jgi:signal transduction histidine kinase
MSIKVRLILCFSVSLLAASLAITALTALLTRKSAQQSFYSLARSQLQGIEKTVNGFMEPGIMDVRYLSDLDMVKNSLGTLNSKKLYPELSRLRQMNSNFGLVFIGNRDGQVLIAPDTVAIPPAYDPRERIWYKDALKHPGKIVLTGPYITIANEVVSSIVTTTYDKEGNILGVIGINYNLQDLTRRFEGMSILKTGYILIIDEEGNIIADGAHARHDNVQHIQDFHGESFDQKIGSAPDGFYRGKGSRGIPLLVVSESMENLGWKIFVIFKESEVYESSYKLLEGILVCFAVILALTLIIVSFLARNIVHPMEELSYASTIIASGEYEKSDAVRKSLQEKLEVTGSGESKALAMSLVRILSTMQERIEIAERAGKEAREASLAKSQFLANMSHEIRTPMNAVIGMTAIARESEDKAKIRDCLAKIETASRHLLSVINDILDISKIESGKFELSPRDFNMKALIDDVAMMIRVSAREKSQTFTIDMAENFPPMFYGDDSRIRQVFINLIGNAVKFTPPGGTISLKVLYAQGAVLCTLQDSGIGMSPEEQTKVFEPFTQAENSTSRRFGGTGLGLPISRHLIEMMGGTISIVSEPDNGSVFTFSFKLPLSSKDTGTLAEAEAAAPPSAEGLAGKSILLVEDNEINREIAEAFLEEMGLKLDFAVNGQEALDKYRAKPASYDLIFMDIQMPLMDGYEATKQIRAAEKENNWRAIPIVAMTADVFQEEIDHCLAVGMNAHVGKPISQGVILQVLNKYLQRKQ